MRVERAVPCLRRRGGLGLQLACGVHALAQRQDGRINVKKAPPRVYGVCSWRWPAAGRAHQRQEGASTCIRGMLVAAA